MLNDDLAAKGIRTYSSLTVVMWEFSMSSFFLQERINFWSDFIYIFNCNAFGTFTNIFIDNCKAGINCDLWFEINFPQNIRIVPIKVNAHFCVKISGKLNHTVCVDAVTIMDPSISQYNYTMLRRINAVLLGMPLIVWGSPFISCPLTCIWFA